MNNIESRQLTFLQFETFPDFLDVAGSTFNRRKLTGDSVNVFRGNASRLQPAFFCELEVALRIGGRHAFITQKTWTRDQSNGVLARVPNISFGEEPPEIAIRATGCAAASARNSWRSQAAQAVAAACALSAMSSVS